MLTKIFGEIECALVDFQQRLGWCSFGIDHVVAFELDMEELQLIELSRVITGNRHVVDEVTRRHQHPVDQQCMRL